MDIGGEGMYGRQKKKINDFCVSLKAAYLMNLVGILYGKVDNEDNGMAHEAN